jgi:site-specific recombinase XerC
LSRASAGANSPLAGAWTQAEQIAEHVRSVDGLGDARREQYSTLILLAAASGLRSSELLALRINDIDFKASTVRVDESSGQQTNGRIGLCKNSPNAEALIFRCKRGGSILETTILKSRVVSDGNLAGINPVFIRQQMGPSSHRLTALTAGKFH